MKKRKVFTAVGLGLLGLGGVVGLYFQRDVLVQFLQWISSIGLWGNVLFILVFLIVGFPFALGYVPMAVGAGYLYGMVHGTITVSIGALSGASLAFWLCRYAPPPTHLLVPLLSVPPLEHHALCVRTRFVMTER
jgi:uncharacterized membrane protein YdjX (TVP38/TMEM64 family)